MCEWVVVVGVSCGIVGSFDGDEWGVVGDDVGVFGGFDFGVFFYFLFVCIVYCL